MPIWAPRCLSKKRRRVRAICKGRTMKLYHARYAQPRPGGVNILEEDFYLPDKHAVRRQLRNKGFWPITIQEQKPPMFEWMDVRSRVWQIQLLRALRFQSATAS